MMRFQTGGETHWMKMNLQKIGYPDLNLIHVLCQRVLRRHGPRLDTARYVTLSLNKKNATYGNFGNLVTYFPVFPLKKCITWVILAFW